MWLHVSTRGPICSAVSLHWPFGIHRLLLWSHYFAAPSPAEGQVISVYGADFGRRDQTTCAYKRISQQTRNTLCPGPTNKVAERYSCKTWWFQLTCVKNHHNAWIKTRDCLSTDVTERTVARSELATSCLETHVLTPISTWRWLTYVNVSETYL